MAKSQDEDVRWLVGQVRPEPHRAPQPIADVLSRLLARRGYGNLQLSRELVELWTRVVGELASRSRPAGFKRGVLEVTVQDSVTLQELTFQQKPLLQRLQESAPHLNVTRLRFRVSGVRQD
jgi:predicted nucleic acid-binding Zn ribbon protein